MCNNLESNLERESKKQIPFTASLRKLNYPLLTLFLSYVQV